MPRKEVSGYGKMILILANQSGSLTRYLPESSSTRPHLSSIQREEERLTSAFPEGYKINYNL
jgi:histidinol phosphatase-like enzyme